MLRRRPILRRIAWLRRNRCSLLLVALCLMILANPLFGSSHAGHKALGVSFLFTLVLASWALRVRPPVLLGLVALAFATATMLVLVPFNDHHHWLRPVSNGAAALFTGIVTVAMLRYVLDAHVISTDKVFGSVAAYVLIAFTFACLFMLVQQGGGKAFYIAVTNDPDGELSWSEAMYFSFTVLTSTGFGEITPITDSARSLIVIEQVLGVMYVAFLVARLANLYGRAPRR
jgi:hypothetical protein